MTVVSNSHAFPICNPAQDECLPDSQVKDLSVLLDPGPEPLANPAEKAAWLARHEQAEALREALQSLHEVPLPHGPLPNARLGQILSKAENRPVRAGGKTVRLRMVHRGHNAKTFQLEVL